MELLTAKETMEEAKNDGVIGIYNGVRNIPVYTGTWDDKYLEKNIKFFEMLINNDYDQMIMVDNKSNNIFFDLVVLRKDGEDTVVPLPVVMESLTGKEYDNYENLISNGVIAWKDIENINEFYVKEADKVMGREEYYKEREMEDRANDIVAQLLEKEKAELEDAIHEIYLDGEDQTKDGTMQIAEMNAAINKLEELIKEVK